MVGFTSYIIENDKEFAAQIDSAIARVGDLKVAFTLIHKDWRKSNRSQFQLQGSGQYPALSPRYAIQKRKDVGNKPIMVRSGKLRDSVSGAENSDSIKIITAKGLTMGTTVGYGVFHQSDDPRRKIPLRKFLFIGAEAPRSAPKAITGRLERWMKIMDSEVQRKLKLSY